LHHSTHCKRIAATLLDANTSAIGGLSELFILNEASGRRREEKKLKKLNGQKRSKAFKLKYAADLSHKTFL
jgi:hypothetical protein